jgi:putative NADPH-quinone reductase
MGRRILVIDGHPDPNPGRLVHALSRAYAEAALGAGHEVRRIDIGSLEFPLLRSEDEYRNRPAPAAAVRAQDDIAWAQHVTLLFPLWLGGVPALLKAFLEQVLRPGFAADDSGGGMPVRRLKGRSIRIVVTMGMPALAYQLWFGAHGVKSLKSGILSLCGFGPIRQTLFGRVADASQAKREEWKAAMATLGREAR